MQNVAVIGAGLAGLTAAHELQGRGACVQVFEKSRGLGGRLATRHADDVQIDHGAQYLTVRGPAFRDFIQQAHDAGAAGLWTPSASEDAKREGAEWWVGRPGMRDIVQPLASGLEISYATRIVEISGEPGDWRLRGESGRTEGPFEIVIVAIPAAQAHGLLAAHDDAFDAIAGVEMLPCAAALFAFNAPLVGVRDVLRPADGPIGWAARDGSKPGRQNAGAETWIVQARPAISAAAMDWEKPTIVRRLQEDFAHLIARDLPPTIYAAGHRWRYAFAEKPLGAPFVLGANMTLAAIGDWCLGPRAEAAYDSGRAVAGALAAA